MTGSDDVPAAQARLDELRRRLYRPDATEADRREHAALQDELARLHRSEPSEEPEQPAEDGHAAAPPAVPIGSAGTPRRHRRLLIGGGIAAALVVAAVGASLAAHPAAPRVAGPTPSATVRRNVDDGAFADPTPAAAVTAAPLTIDGRTVVGQQTTGGGSAVVAVDPSSAQARGGRLVVSVTSSDPSPVGWRAERRAARPDGSSYLQVVALSVPALREGDAPSTDPYEGAAPTRIVVQAATGVGWTITVAFTG